MSEQTPPTPDDMTANHRGRRILLGALGLLVILGGALTLRLVFFAGCVGSDDVTSWQVAHHLSRGVVWPEKPETSVPTVRHGLILPAAAVFTVFGSDESAAMIYPIFASLLGIAALWDVTRRLTKNLWAAHLAGAVAALASLNIVNSSMFLPDVPMTAMCSLALWCMVVGYRPEGRIGLGGRIALVAAGALAAFAGMHKVVGYAMIAPMGLWALSLIISRKWRWSLLWIPAGFLAVLAAEHIMFWRLYGDPWIRWKVISAGLDKYAAAMERGGRAVLNSKRIGWWVGQVAREFPSFTMVMLVSILAALAGVVLWWRQVRVRLFCFTMLFLVALRIVEFTRTFSYQPRRLLPFVAGAAVLGAFALHKLRWRRVAAVLGVAFLAAQSIMLFAGDAEKMHRYAAQLGPERWLHKWSLRNEEAVRENGLYIDSRTFSAVKVMGGHRDLEALGFRQYTKTAMNAPGPMTSVEPEPVYTDNSFFFENTRTIKVGQMHAPHRRKVYAGAFSEIPPAWRLEAIVGNRTTSAWNCALYRVRAASPPTRPAADREIHIDFAGENDVKRDRIHGWYVRWARFQEQAKPEKPKEPPLSFAWEKIDQTDGTSRLAIRFRKGKALSLVSGAANISTVPPKDLICKAGRIIVACFPLRKIETETKRDWANVKLWIIGYDQTGKRHKLLADRRRLYYSRQELRGYVIPKFDVYGLRVMVQLKDPGRYELEPIKIDVYDTLPSGIHP